MADVLHRSMFTTRQQSRAVAWQWHGTEVVVHKVSPLQFLPKHSVTGPLRCSSKLSTQAFTDTESSSSSSSSSNRPEQASAAALARGPDDPPDLAMLVRRLDELLHTAATAADGGTESRRAEAAAVAMAARGRELGLLRGFGAVRQVPKRLYSIEELRLNRVETEKLLSPKDTSLNAVRTQAQVAAALGLAAAAWANHWDGGGVLAALFGVVFVLMADQVANGGGGEALLVDSLGRLLRPSYAARVAYHEAGHLLVAYLVGLMPRAYTLSSMDAFLRYRALNIQAGTRFCDGEFAAEVATGRLKSSSLDRYTCVALAGVVTEYLRFGVAEGGLGDVQQLDAMFRALQ
ncbi:hypothetical protein VOLCADRAFT_103923, partial [Volvox carteri f. nagariensis]